MAITYLGWSRWVWHWGPYNFESTRRPPIHHTKARRKLYSRGSTEAWETCGWGLYIYRGQQLLCSRPQKLRYDGGIFAFRDTCIYWQHSRLNKLPYPSGCQAESANISNLFNTVCHYTVLSCTRTRNLQYIVRPCQAGSLSLDVQWAPSPLSPHFLYLTGGSTLPPTKRLQMPHV